MPAEDVNHTDSDRASRTNSTRPLFIVYRSTGGRTAIELQYIEFDQILGQDGHLLGTVKPACTVEVSIGSSGNVLLHSSANLI